MTHLTRTEVENAATRRAGRAAVRVTVRSEAVSILGGVYSQLVCVGIERGESERRADPVGWPRTASSRNLSQSPLVGTLFFFYQGEQ